MNIKQKAFSIIELLVVIVIIGILASLVVAGYGFVARNAVNTTIQNDLTNASEQLEVFNYQNKVYPQTINCSIPNSTTNLCIKAGTGNTFTYSIDNSANPKGYCFSIKNGSTSYYMLDKNTRYIMSGDCISQSGLVLNLDAQHLASYSGSGTTWNDLSSSNNNATITNSPLYNATQPYNFYFDGVGCKYVRISSLEGSNYPTNSTISLWMKLDNNSTDNQSVLDSYRTNNGHIFIRSTSLNANLQIAFQSTTLTSYPYVYTWTSSTKNQWFNLVITADVTNLTGKVYVNSTQLNSGSITESNWTPNGQILTFMSVACSNPAIGNLSQVQIYNRVLNQTEITQNFSAQRSRYGI